MRKFTKSVLATLFGLGVAGCATLGDKKAEEIDAKKILEQPGPSLVIKKGDEGHAGLYELFKAEIEAKVKDAAKRDSVLFHCDGRNAQAYMEVNTVSGFQPEDTAIASKPYGIDKMLELGKAELKECIKNYDTVIANMYADKKISVEERAQLGEYVASTVANMKNANLSDPLSQMLLRHMLKEIDAQITHYAGNGKREYYLAVGLVDGKDIGLTSNPQKVDVPEAGIAAILSAGGSDSYAKATEQAKKSPLNEYTPVPPKSEYGDREAELAKAKTEWTEIRLTEAQALANTGKVGVSTVGTRLSADRMTGYSDGKFENREIAPGATYVQVVVTGADADEKVAEAAKFGGKLVGE